MDVTIRRARTTDVRAVRRLIDGYAREQILLDKPTVTLTTPADPDTASAFINIRVADIGRVHREWSARGAHFLTDPKDHGVEIRAYIRDPDGHLIEVGQSRAV